jgi:hypothetical protein
VDPFTMAMLGTTALQGFSTLLGGFAQAKQAANEAQQARINFRNSQIAGTEAYEQNALQLRRTQGTVNSLEAARGVSLDSPTSQAVDSEVQTMSDRNNAIQQFGFLQQQQDQMQANGYSSQEAWALPLTGMGAAAQGLKGLSSAFPNFGVSGGSALSSVAGLY